MSLVRAFALILRGLVRGRAALALENLALRQQLAVLRRSIRRPRLRPRDRLFWVMLRRLCEDWRSHLIVVKPETVAAGIASVSGCSGDGSLGGEADLEFLATSSI